MTAYKNRGKETRHRWNETRLFASVLLMVVSLLLGRGVLSAATILFLLLAIGLRKYKT